MKKKSILIYSDWKEDIEEMTADEAKNFILNVIRNSNGEEVILPTRAEKMHWMQIKRILDINKDKYEKRAQRSRENGARGGRPENNPAGYSETQ